MTELYGSDAYAPREIAQRVESVGVAKARLETLPLLMLGVLAGAFIGLGALFFVLVKSDATLSWAVSQVLGGLVFSLGLLLVVVAGAELFTGNNLLAMAWADGRSPAPRCCATGSWCARPISWAPQAWRCWYSSAATRT